MTFNPLGLPKWSHSSKKEEPKLRLGGRWETIDPGKKSSTSNTPVVSVNQPIVPRALTRVGEAQERGRTSERMISIEIRGLGSKSGNFTVAYDPSYNLGHYLKDLNCQNVATKASMRDLSNLSAGPVRLRYVPSPDSKIFIGPSAYSPLAQYQRSRFAGDAAEDLAVGIKGDSIPLTYGGAKKPEPKKRDNFDDVEQW